MYKRLSSHLTSIDLPDLPDLPDAFRETASKVESALQQARNNYESHARKEKDKDDDGLNEDEDSEKNSSQGNSSEPEKVEGR